VTICLFSMLAFETVFAREGLGEADSGNFDFIEIEAANCRRPSARGSARCSG
jgi:hypothetical protein